jgi:hypothetical protein
MWHVKSKNVRHPRHMVYTLIRAKEFPLLIDPLIALRISNVSAPGNVALIYRTGETDMSHLIQLTVNRHNSASIRLQQSCLQLRW